MAVRVTLFPILNRESIPALWAHLMEGLNPPEAHYGPEYAVTRPRSQDSYFSVFAWQRDDTGTNVGLVYTQTPAPTTRVFALGLFQMYRGRGLGPLLRDSCLDLCFRNPDVYKVETEVYASNHHSLGALHGRYGRMTEEGRQRATIFVAGMPVDRVLFGITRPEWESHTEERHGGG